MQDDIAEVHLFQVMCPRHASQWHNNTAVISATGETYSIKYILAYSWACRSTFSNNNACGENKRAGTCNLSYIILIASGNKVSCVRLC
jgi:hypothetical protein